MLYLIILFDFNTKNFVFYSTVYLYIYVLVIYVPDGNFRTNMAPFVHQFCIGIGRGLFLLYTSEIGTFALKWHLFGNNFALVYDGGFLFKRRADNSFKTRSTPVFRGGRYTSLCPDLTQVNQPIPFWEVGYMFVICLYVYLIKIRC